MPIQVRLMPKSMVSVILRTAAQDAAALGARDRAEIFAPIVCADNERRLVYGLAMEPDEVDTHGEYTTAEDIERAAHGFMESRLVGIQHEREAPAQVVESYITQADMTLGGQNVKAGSWIVVVKVLDDTLWAAVKAGEFGGVSIGGWAEREADVA